MKSRKTFGFWIAVVLPFLLITILFAGAYSNSEKMARLSGQVIWMNYMAPILHVMGILLLPIFVIFISYSANNVEHRADTWKSLFSLPINKWTIYSSKYVYVLLLNALCLSLFATFILISGYILGYLFPDLKFHQYSAVSLAYQIHFKLFLASFGILSIQFLLSLIWSDFIKPMGIGFFLSIVSVIITVSGWKYAWTVPYAHPILALQSMKISKVATLGINVDLFTKEVIVSLIVGLAAFVAGYFVVAKRSVK